MIVLTTNGSGAASSTTVELKGGLRYTLSYTNRSDQDPDGTTNGVTGGTMTPTVDWREGYDRIVTPAINAAVTVALSGSNNDLTWSAVTAGLAGNSITIEGVNTGVPSQALAVEVNGTAITIKLGLGTGTPQVETLTVLGTATSDGNVAYSFVSTATGTVPVSVAIANGDTAAVAAGKMRTALQATAAITAYWAIGGTGANITATELVAAADDTALAMSYTQSIGMTNVGSSTNTTAGVAPAITSTGDDVKAAVAASAAAAALVVGIDAGGNDGSGVMTVFGPATLATGADAELQAEFPNSPLLDSEGAEIAFDLTTAVGGIEFIAPADGTLNLAVAGAGNTKTLFANVTRMVQG